MQSWEEQRNLKCNGQGLMATWTKLVEGNRLREEEAPKRNAHTMKKNTVKLHVFAAFEMV